MRTLLAGARRRIPYRPRAQATYSQTGEDRIVAMLLELMGIERPTYLDVGAHHPFQLSNTALLHRRGSRGLNIEADPDSIGAFHRYRRNDINLNIGIGPEPGRLTFYRMSAPTLNTFSQATAEMVQAEGEFRIVDTIDVEVRTLADVLAEHWSGCPDFLTIDTEGGDVDILRSMPDWPAMPAVVCAETLTFGDAVSQQKIPEIPEVLAPLGYVAIAETYINTIFVRADRMPGRRP
jgi:FkbM family methyltransferase